jgi:putative ABC transport system permease protein
MADRTGLGVGDRTHLLGPLGIDQPAVITGIGVAPMDVGGNAGIPGEMLTPAFADRWFPRLAKQFGSDLRPGVMVRLRPGASFGAASHRIVAAHPGAGLSPQGSLASDVIDGLRAQATAYWVLAAGSAVASLALVALLVRQAIRTGPADLEVLAALGRTRRQRTIQIAAPEMLAALAGVLLAAPIAVFASPWVRTGLAKLADPVHGRWFDSGALGLATLGVAVLLVLAIGLLARLETRPTSGGRRAERPSSLGGLAWLSPESLIGARSGLLGNGRSTRRQAWAAVAGLALAGGCVIAVSAWSTSAHRLLHTPRMMGWNFDADLEAADQTAATPIPDLTRHLSDSSMVSKLARFDFTTWTLKGLDVDLYAFDGLKGSIHPPLLRGRAPAGPGEIALGPFARAHAGVDIGDTLTVRGAKGPVTLTVVGEALYPGNLGNNGWGNGASVTPETWAKLGVQPLRTGLFVDLVPGAHLADLHLGKDVAVVQATPPPSVAHLANAGGINEALMAFMVLVALVVLASSVWSARQRLAGAFAVLRATGLAPRQVVASFWWLALLTSTVGGLLAVVIGLPLGRFVWSATEKNLGVPEAFAPPTAAIVAVVVGALVVGSLAAVFAGWRCGRSSIAAVLRAE